MNPDLTTYNGVAITQLAKTKSSQYKTGALSMSASQVRSKLALETTGGRWRSNICFKDERGCANECPKDGILYLQFTYHVVPSRVLAALTVDKGAVLQDWVGPCSEDQPTNTFDRDAPASCVAVKPRNLLSDGTMHTLRLPKLSRVSHLGGGIKTEWSVSLTGGLPFKFRFKQKTIPTERPVFRRYTLYLRHGLQILIAAVNAKKVRLVM